MLLTSSIQKAINKAAALHQGQKRKGDSLPYIVHPYSVAWILANYTNDENIIIAGFLHDVLEDVQAYSAKDMEKDFGKKITNIVKELSEDKELKLEKGKKASWQARKEKYLVNLENDSFEAMMVCAADKIHNLQSMIGAFQKQGSHLWAKFNASLAQKLWFYKEVLNVLKRNLDDEIVEELKQTYLKARDLLGGVKANF